MRTRSDGTQTRSRILTAAAEVFAERGFVATTHAEIGRRGAVNTALVNYHFTDKETLYRKAWEFAAARTAEKYRLDGAYSGNAPASERLRGLIAAMVRAAADPESYDQEIWRKELAQPTGLLTAIRQKTVLPLRRQMAEIVGELLGTPPDSIVRLAVMSIIAQCRVPVSLSDEQATGGRFVDANLETRIDHIVRFSLGGLAECRKEIGVPHPVER